MLIRHVRQVGIPNLVKDICKLSSMAVFLQPRWYIVHDLLRAIHEFDVTVEIDKVLSILFDYEGVHSKDSTEFFQVECHPGDTGVLVVNSRKTVQGFSVSP